MFEINIIIYLFTEITMSNRIVIHKGYTTHGPWARSGPQMCYIRPLEQVKNTRNFSWM